MPLAIVSASTNSGTFSNTSGTATFGQTTSSGSLLIVPMVWPRTTGVTTNATSNITTTGFVQAVEHLTTTGNANMMDGGAIYAKYSGAAEASAAITMSASRKVGWWTAEVTGHAASPLDKTNGSDSDTSAVTAQSTGSTGVLAQANNIVFAILGVADDNADTFTVPTGFTQLGSPLQVGGGGQDLTAHCVYQIVSSTAALDPNFTWGVAEPALAVISVFQDATPGGGGGTAGILRNSTESIARGFSGVQGAHLNGVLTP